MGLHNKINIVLQQYGKEFCHIKINMYFCIYGKEYLVFTWL